MDKRLFDILNWLEENYLFPFYWQRSDHTKLIPEQIQRIYDSGCRAFCVKTDAVRPLLCPRAIYHTRTALS